jgi:hypothetical protein
LALPGGSGGEPEVPEITVKLIVKLVKAIFKSRIKWKLYLKKLKNG